MILTDTGPLVALIVASDQHRQRVQDLYAQTREAMLTTESCIGETLHLLGRAGGWPAQNALWNLLRLSAFNRRGA